MQSSPVLNYAACFLPGTFLHTTAAVAAAATSTQLTKPKPVTQNKQHTELNRACRMHFSQYLWQIDVFSCEREIVL